MMEQSDSPSREGLAASKVKEAPVSLKSVNWGRLLGYLKPYRGRMALAILALLLSSGFGLAFPLVIVRLLDSVTKAKDFGPLNMLAAAAGRHLPVAGRLLCLPILPAGLYRRAHRLRPAHLAVPPPAGALARFLRRPAGGRCRLRLSSDVTQMRTMLTTNLTTLLSQVLTWSARS